MKSIKFPNPEETLKLEAFLVPNNTAFTMYPGEVVANIAQLYSLNVSHKKDTLSNAKLTLSDGNGQVHTMEYNPGKIDPAT